MFDPAMYLYCNLLPQHYLKLPLGFLPQHCYQIILLKEPDLWELCYSSSILSHDQQYDLEMHLLHLAQLYYHHQ